MFSKTAPDSPSRLRRWSLATRLTIWYTGSAFLLLAVAAAVLYRVVVETLDAEDKDDLAVEISDLQRILKDHPLNLPALRKEVEEESATPSFSPVFVRVFTLDGQPLVETPGMSTMLEPGAFPQQPVASVKQGPVVSLQSHKNRSFRGLTTVIEKDYLVQVAVDQTGNVKLHRAYRRQIALVLAIGLVICALIGHTIARRGLQPVQEIAASMQHIRSTTLNERIASASLPAELGVLAATFNEMLDRLEDAFSRLSHSSANIAHELRTPINNLCGEVEVALGKPRASEEYRDVLASCLEEGRRLTQLIDSLLFLARAENPKTQIQRQILSLPDELVTLRDFYEAGASQAGVTLTVQAALGLTAPLDRTLFQRTIGNLLENALVHTPRGGRIEVVAARDNASAKITVTDTGCGIPADQLPELFERFHRVDVSRSKETGGHGLGLAIVHSIARLHGGTVTVNSQVDVGTTVTLWFPTVLSAT